MKILYYYGMTPTVFVHSLSLSTIKHVFVCLLAQVGPQTHQQTQTFHLFKNIDLLTQSLCQSIDDNTNDKYWFNLVNFFWGHTIYSSIKISHRNSNANTLVFLGLFVFNVFVFFLFYFKKKRLFSKKKNFYGKKRFDFVYILNTHTTKIIWIIIIIIITGTETNANAHTNTAEKTAIILKWKYHRHLPKRTGIHFWTTKNNNNNEILNS